ncbi:MAG: hypothetical protein JKX94_07025 [Sneathiella sp.]|nr:hypothetical protein [Sneathiella sp.]
MKHYEELTGSKGKRVYYRAERFKASVLMRDISPVIDVNNQSFELFDLSMSGLSFVDPKHGGWIDEFNKDFPVSLKLGPNEIFQGHGKICRVEPHEGRQKIAVELTKGYLNIQDILEHHDELAMQNHLQTGLKDMSADVPSGYKSIVSDAVYMLRSVRDTLEKIEKELPTETPRHNERILEVILACEQNAHARWKDISKRGMLELNRMRGNKHAFEAAKHYTEKTLTPELMGGKSWQRAYEKPLGYPGDYEVMNFAYNLSMIGDTAYEKLCHRLGTSTGEFIATRMTMVKQKIAELTSLAAQQGKTDYKITSLGCGPSQEAVNFLKGHVLPLSVHFTLIDQDHDALAYAYKNCYPEVSRLDGRATVRCLHATFLEFLATGNLFKKIESQDLIYAVGLVDYLSDKRAKRMACDLYENLKPGGTMMIGSMRDSDASLEWQVEFVTDWQLEYRDETEMLSMTEKLPSTAMREVVVDSTGHCHILVITKPV